MDIDVPEIEEAPVEEPRKPNRHERRAMLAKFWREIGKIKIVRNLRKQHRQSQAKKAGNMKWWEVK